MVAAATARPLRFFEIDFFCLSQRDKPARQASATSQIALCEQLLSSY
jgi:hypothetical protein